MSTDATLRILDAADVTSPNGEVTAPPRRSAWVPGEVGVWVFILGDMLMFALFFGVFVYERGQAVDLFNASRDTLNTTLGAINTLVLLTSSLFVVIGVRAMRNRANLAAQRAFAGAFACGLIFAFDKYLEWSDHIRTGLTPAKNEFYMLFFVFTGIHFVHVLVGMCVLVFLWRLARKAHRAPADMRAAECGASYWHLVDLLWVVLFPLLYLMA